MPFDGTTAALRLARPRLLAAAARAGAALYRREKDLPGLIPQTAAARGVVAALMAAEAACDEKRKSLAPEYSPARHVKLLSALIVESARAAVH